MTILIVMEPPFAFQSKISQEVEAKKYFSEETCQLKYN